MSKKKRKKVENKNIVTNDLDSTEELDVSFIDTKNNKKDEIEEENLEEVEVQKSSKKKDNDNNIVTSDLDSTQDLDVSFIDTKSNDKKKKMVRQTLEKGRKEIAEQKNNDISENNNNSSSVFLIITLIICFIGLMVFIWYHFLTFDHKHTKEIVKEKETVVEKIVDENILFLGDSITYAYDLDKYFEKHRVVNSSVLGVRTGGILENMKKRVYDYNPSKVFILIGINDLIADKKSDVVPNIGSMINLIKENRPYAKIYLESIYPINKTDNEKLSGALKDKAVSNDDVKEVNSELVKLSEKLGVTYIDVFSKLVLEDGNLNSKYTDDGLHLNSVGYDTVTEVLSKYVED